MYRHLDRLWSKAWRSLRRHEERTRRRRRAAPRYRPAVRGELLESRRLLATTYFDAGTLTTTPVVYADSVQGTDADIYRFQLADAANVSVVLSDETERTYIELGQDVNGNDVIDSEDSLEYRIVYGAGVTLTEPVAPGKYLLRIMVYDSRDSTTYSLRLNANAIAGAQDAGNTLVAARDIGTLSTVPRDFVDVIQVRDVDVFRFQLTAAANATAAFTGLTEGASFRLVQDFNGNLQVDSDETLDSLRTESSTTTMTETLSAGTYFLIIEPYSSWGWGNSSGANTAYTLSLSAIEIANVQDAGDTLATARNVDVLTTTPVTMTDVVQLNDIDVYRVQLTEASYMIASVTGMTETVHIGLVQDLNGNLQVDSSEILESREIGPSNTTMTEPLAIGTYFLIVEEYSWWSYTRTNSAYSLSLSAIPIANAQDAGSTLAAARNVGVLTTTPTTLVDVVQLTDVDVYQFQMSEASTVTASFNDVTEYGNIRLIQDLNSNLQIDSGEVVKSTTMTDKTSVVASLSAGSYYLVVERYPYYSDTNTAYTLTLNSKIPPIPEIEVREGAALVVAGTTVVDFGTVTHLGAGSVKTFTIKNLSPTDPLMLQPATVPSNSGYTVVGNFAVNHVVPPNGTAQLTVRLNSTTLGAKSATLSFTNDDLDENPFNIRLSGSVVAPANYLPTITEIADVSILEDAATAALAFTVGDVETPTDNLQITGVSSNLALVPAANIVLSGSGADRTVTVTPSPNQFGTATITITVTDALGGRATETYTVTVQSVNDLPTISDLPDVVIDEDQTTGPLAFDVGDIETAANGLTIRAVSSVQALVPDANLVFGGSGLHRTLTVTPARRATGSTVITLTVTDAQGTIATDTFRVTVRSPNHLPTISPLDDIGMDEDTATPEVSLVIGDTETPFASLTLAGSSSDPTLIPNANIFFGGSGTNRTVQVRPASNRSGVATITVTVADADGGLTTETFVATVRAVNDPPTLTDIADVVVEEDQPTGALYFSVGDPETPADDLVVSVSSSNLALVPEANLVLTGNGEKRWLTVTPAAELSGTALITLTVRDGDDVVATDTFRLTVIAANRRPTITRFSDTSIDEDGKLFAVSFTIGDLETPAADLSLLGVSSDTVLVPDANIVFSGSGQNRLVTVTPVANHYGVATIVIIVADDQGGRATGTFTLTVQPVNDAPTITTIANVTVDEDHATNEIPFVVGDVETVAGSLVVRGTSSNRALVPDDQIVILGTGSQRTVVVTPNTDQFGTATVSLTVADAGGETTVMTFLVTVRPINDTPVIATETPSLVIAEDTAETSLILTIGDAETAAANLTLSVTSSNSALIPLDNIRFVGSGPDRVMTVSPIAGLSGTVVIIVTVHDDSSETSTVTVSVKVVAVNDPPIPTRRLEDQTVNERSPFTLIIPSDLFTDEDVGDSLTYSVTRPSGEPLPDWLTFSSATWTLSGTPKNEDVGSITVWVTATDIAGGNATVAFEMVIFNVNDPPQLGAPMVPQSAQEDTPFNLVIPATTFTDVDLGDRLTLVVSLVDGSSLPGWLTFDPTTWSLRGTPAGDAVGVWKIRVAAFDLSGESVSVAFELVVTNINDAPSGLRLTPSSVFENIAGVAIGSLTAIDEDQADRHVFSVSDDRFEIVAGQLRLRPGVSLDFESTSRVVVMILVTDSGTPALSQTIAVEIEVRDANDRPTAVKLDSSSVSERISGAVIGRLSGTDPDVGQTLTFSVGDSRFEVIGNVLRLKAGAFLEASSGATFTVNVSLTDNGEPAQTATLPLELTVLPNLKPWQNEVDRLDVNRDGFVVPLDVLLIVNELNSPTVVGAQGTLPRARSTVGPSRFFDVNGDGFCTALDVLIIINQLNAQASEGESPRDALFASDGWLSALPTPIDRFSVSSSGDPTWDQIFGPSPGRVSRPVQRSWREPGVSK